jgi:hypothetical protein
MEGNKRLFYLAFDISTTNVGMSIFSDKGKLMALRHLKLKTDKKIPEYQRYIVKSLLFKEFIEEYKQYIEKDLNGYIDGIFVEEPLIMSNNSFTSALLQKFNGISCYILYDIFKIAPELITVHDSRKEFCPEFVSTKYKTGQKIETLSFPKDIDKKVYIWEKVNRIENNIEWLYDKKGNLAKESYDLSDSYCVGYSMLKKKNIIK